MGIDSFKPESLDATKPGTVEVTQGADMTSVRVEQASYQVCGYSVLMSSNHI